MIDAVAVRMYSVRDVP